MNCKNCGQPITEGAQACPHCGAPVEAVTASSVATPTLPPQTVPQDVPPSAPQPAIRQAVQYPFWYIPGVTIFSAKKGVATVLPGLIIVTNATTQQEVYRYAIGPDIQLSQSYGNVKFKFINGQRIGLGLKGRKYEFYFNSPIRVYFLFFLIFRNSQIAKNFVASCKQAAGL